MNGKINGEASKSAVTFSTIIFVIVWNQLLNIWTKMRLLFRFVPLVTGSEIMVKLIKATNARGYHRKSANIINRVIMIDDN